VHEVFVVGALINWRLECDAPSPLGVLLKSSAFTLVFQVSFMRSTGTLA